MEKPNYLESGELARLMPVSTKVECRNMSVTAAVLMAVKEFSDVLLGTLNAPTGKKSKVEIWLELVFKKHSEDRSDGLIIVSKGSKNGAHWLRQKFPRIWVLNRCSDI